MGAGCSAMAHGSRGGIVLRPLVAGLVRKRPPLHRLAGQEVVATERRRRANVKAIHVIICTPQRPCDHAVRRRRGRRCSFVECVPVLTQDSPAVMPTPYSHGYFAPLAPLKPGGATCLHNIHTGHAATATQVGEAQPTPAIRCAVDYDYDAAIQHDSRVAKTRTMCRSCPRCSCPAQCNRHVRTPRCRFVWTCDQP